MNYNIKEQNDRKYIFLESKFNSEGEIMDIISICMEHGINYLMLSNNSLSDGFLNLKTGLAGIALQKFMNYRIQVVAIIDDESRINKRFSELMLELNKSNNFRVVNNFESAKKHISNIN
ncbi:DUF4180 domain-containing protein [Clostridioides difficile]|nr:DUF4180 domain-containing protein [Clostridioides difficile]MDI7816611.1 DUF4180 domain-containing protein [Clostridioides difficile]NJI80885.1 DUF4180 domain-containing protein [Clostridioides difficile]